ncbi:MAG: 4Fe-4S binding protein [Kiritimatiellaeota bacterium]|nr:4Fe-4S binding protein [Kiritimatiellota bacterium]
MKKHISRIIRIILSALVFALVIVAFNLDRLRPEYPWLREMFSSVRTGVMLLPPQAGPAFLKTIETGAKFALVWSIVFVVVALLFGRVYCAFMCPLGIMQDIIAWVARVCAPRSKCAPQSNMRLVRYTVFAVTIGLLAAGWALMAKYLEPFTVFGRMAANPFSVVAVMTFVIFAALVVWKKRVFCTTLCPVGTLLGLLSKISLFKMRINKSACVHCKLCERKCPTGCINGAAAEIDNERCVRCMNCVTACTKNGISMGIAKLRNCENAKSFNTQRRGFLTVLAGIPVAAFLASFASGRFYKPRAKRSPATRMFTKCEAPQAVYPPGAGSPERFASKCTACLLCVANCRGRVITAPRAGVPAVHLEFENGMCEFECAKCGHVCPTGAIKPMKRADKQRWRIGMVDFNEKICVAYVKGNDCGACAEHCPTGAVHMEEIELPEHGKVQRVPVIDEAVCIGCGCCEYACPRDVRAIRVKPVPIQVQAADPAEYFKTENNEEETPTAEPSAEDDWLI